MSILWRHDCKYRKEVFDSEREPGEPLFDAVLFRALIKEWIAAQEIGWARPLSIEEGICVLTAVEQGYTTTALDARGYHRG